MKQWKMGWTRFIDKNGIHEHRKCYYFTVIFFLAKQKSKYHFILSPLTRRSQCTALR